MINIRQLMIISILFILLTACKRNEKDMVKEYYPNGKLRVIKNYKKSVIHGQAQWFYNTGNLEQVVEFSNGKENGNAYYFYESGAIKSSRNWENGKMVGYANDFYDSSVWVIKAVLFYNAKGDLVYKKKYDLNGKVIAEEGRRYE